MLSVAQQQRAVLAPFKHNASVKAHRSSRAPVRTCALQKPRPELSQLVVASQQPLMPPRCDGM